MRAESLRSRAILADRASQGPGVCAGSRLRMNLVGNERLPRLAVLLGAYRFYTPIPRARQRFFLLDWSVVQKLKQRLMQHGGAATFGWHCLCNVSHAVGVGVGMKYPVFLQLKLN